MQMLSKEMLYGNWSEVRWVLIRGWNYYVANLIGWSLKQPIDSDLYVVELAKLDDGQLVYGSVQEIEQYVEQQDRFVTDYLDHMSPAHVQKFGKYVGKSVTDPYSVGGTHSRKMDYNLGRIVVTERF